MSTVNEIARKVDITATMKTPSLVTYTGPTPAAVYATAAPVVTT